MQDEFGMTNLGKWSLKTGGVKLNYMMTMIKLKYYWQLATNTFLISGLRVKTQNFQGKVQGGMLRVMIFPLLEF